MAYTTTTRATLRQRIRETLLANWWSDDELNRLINEAIRVWNVLVGYHRQTTLLTVVAGTIFLDLNTTVANHLMLMRVEFTDTHTNLVSLNELDKMNTRWMCDESTSISNIAPVGLNLIAFNPSSTTDFSMYVESIRTAILPTTDASFIQVSEENISALINYVKFIGALKEGGSELKEAMPLLQNFLMQAAKYNADLNQISIYRQMLGYGGQQETRPLNQESQTPRGLHAE